MSSAGGGGGAQRPDGSTVGWGQQLGGGDAGRAVFGCTGPLRPDRCAGVGLGGRREGLMGGDKGEGSTSNNRPSHHKYVSRTVCESHAWRLMS